MKNWKVDSNWTFKIRSDKFCGERNASPVKWNVQIIHCNYLAYQNILECKWRNSWPVSGQLHSWTDSGVGCLVTAQRHPEEHFWAPLNHHRHPFFVPLCCAVLHYSFLFCHNNKKPWPLPLLKNVGCSGLKMIEIRAFQDGLLKIAASWHVLFGWICPP